MTLSIYVDGSGGANSGYGFFVNETGESFYENKSDITNNQAEYMAIISALKKFENSNDEIIIFSDSKNTVNQLNHEFAINNDDLRSLAREAWSLMENFSNLTLTWIPRNKNLVGKMDRLDFEEDDGYTEEQAEKFRKKVQKFGFGEVDVEDWK